MLISQTGAGKTNLRKNIMENNSNYVIVNSDLYKKFRPDAEEIMQKDPTNFGALTGIDCYDHANNVIDFATTMGYNLLLECAPSVKEGLIGVDIPKLQQHQYSTNFHVLAVGDLISSLAIHYRYELEIENGLLNQGTKLTDLKRHDESYKAVEQVVRELPARTVTIYRRGTAQESRVPISLSNVVPREEISTITNLRLLRNARDKSNFEYVSKSNDNNFESDYKTIKYLMNNRNAPKAQVMQLEEVYNKYLNFLGRQSSK